MYVNLPMFMTYVKLCKALSFCLTGMSRPRHKRFALAALDRYDKLSRHTCTTPEAHHAASHHRDGRRTGALLKLRSIPFGMKLFERPRRYGGDPAHPPAEGGAHAGPGGGAGLAPRLDRRHHVGRPGRRQCRAVVGLGARQGREVAVRPAHDGVWFSTLEDAQRTRPRCIACRTASSRRWPSRRSPRAGSTRPTSRCSTPHPAR